MLFDNPDQKNGKFVNVVTECPEVIVFGPLSIIIRVVKECYRLVGHFSRTSISVGGIKNDRVHRSHFDYIVFRSAGLADHQNEGHVRHIPRDVQHVRNRGILVAHPRLEHPGLRCDCSERSDIGVGIDHLGF